MESLPKPHYDGLEAFWEVLALGARLIGVFPHGAYIAKEEGFQAAFTDSQATVEALMSGAGDPEGRAKGQPIRLFRFCPAEAGLLCLDIDRGHGNGKDGLVEFYALFERFGKPRQALPSFLQNIAGGSFPVYTATPRGGFHLFFRHRRPEVKKCLLAPNVEVFHSHSYLTAPGSRKEDRSYVLHGHLADAPQLPPILERRLPKADGEAKRRAFFRLNLSQERGIPSLEQLAAWAEQDKCYSGKNELCHAIALRAARKDYPYSAEEVFLFLSSYPGTSGHRQIRDAVRSAFRYMKKF
jgi:hypothetical protein